MWRKLYNLNACVHTYVLGRYKITLLYRFCLSVEVQFLPLWTGYNGVIFHAWINACIFMCLHMYFCPQIYVHFLSEGMHSSEIPARVCVSCYNVTQNNVFATYVCTSKVMYM